MKFVFLVLLVCLVCLILAVGICFIAKWTGAWFLLLFLYVIAALGLRKITMMMSSLKQSKIESEPEPE
ncbi:MAG: hypothetical protein HQ539_02100 [Parcubacteria group bacterium]|nr:hypothetical protein [Parcubacteria group bacterium]